MHDPNANELDANSTISQDNDTDSARIPKATTEALSSSYVSLFDVAAAASPRGQQQHKSALEQDEPSTDEHYSDKNKNASSSSSMHYSNYLESPVAEMVVPPSCDQLDCPPSPLDQLGVSDHFPSSRHILTSFSQEQQFGYTSPLSSRTTGVASRVVRSHAILSSSQSTTTAASVAQQHDRCYQDTNQSSSTGSYYNSNTNISSALSSEDDFDGRYIPPIQRRVTSPTHGDPTLDPVIRQEEDNNYHNAYHRLHSKIRTSTMSIHNDEYYQEVSIQRQQDIRAAATVRRRRNAPPPFVHKPERAGLLPEYHCFGFFPLPDQYSIWWRVGSQCHDDGNGDGSNEYTDTDGEDTEQQQQLHYDHWTHPLSSTQILTELDWTDAEAHQVAPHLYRRSRACFWASVTGCILLISFISITTLGLDFIECNDIAHRRRSCAADGMTLCVFLSSLFATLLGLQLVGKADQRVTGIVDDTFREDGCRLFMAATVTNAGAGGYGGAMSV